MEFTDLELKVIKEIVETKRGLASYYEVQRLLDSIVKKCEKNL